MFAPSGTWRGCLFSPPPSARSAPPPPRAGAESAGRRGSAGGLEGVWRGLRGATPPLLAGSRPPPPPSSQARSSLRPGTVGYRSGPDDPTAPAPPLGTIARWGWQGGGGGAAAAATPPLDPCPPSYYWGYWRPSDRGWPIHPRGRAPPGGRSAPPPAPPAQRAARPSPARAR
eukprot:1185635-Prorocentrum_minimum.AAC.1